MSRTVTIGLATSPAAPKLTVTVSSPLAPGLAGSVPRRVSVSVSLGKPSSSRTMMSRLFTKSITTIGVPVEMLLENTWPRSGPEG